MDKLRLLMKRESRRRI